MESTFRFGLSLLVKVGCTRRINIKRLHVTRGRGAQFSAFKANQRSLLQTHLGADVLTLCARPPALSSSFMDPHHPHHLPFPQVLLLPPPPPFFLYLFLFDVEWKTLVTSEQGFCQGSIANRVTPSSPSSQILLSFVVVIRVSSPPNDVSSLTSCSFSFRTFSFARSLPPSPPSRKKIRDTRKKKEVIYCSFLFYCWCLPRNGIALQGSTAVRQQVKTK